MAKYTIGIDFGNNSGRAALIDVATGEVKASSTSDYYYGLIHKNFINGTPLPSGYALSHPQDFLDVFLHVIKDVLTDVSASDVIGVGIDFASSAILPVDKTGTPLAFLNDFKYNPHAYIKLAFHKSATKEADKFLDVANDRKEPWLKNIRNQISPDMVFPKILETYNNAPEVYENAAYFVEVSDWIVWQLTGNYVHNTYSAGFKCFWSKENGYPSKDFFKAVEPAFENIIEDKFNKTILPVGTLAGTITKEISMSTGLVVGTSVCVGSSDLLACLPAVKIHSPNKMLGVMGTSTTLLINTDKKVDIEGLSGPITDAFFKDTVCYSVKQVSVGDAYSWFLNNYVPPEYHEQAKREGRNLHSYLAQQMMKLTPGENGVICLNWFGGSSTTTLNDNLTGLFVGVTTKSRVEHLYRAIIESMAFDTRRVMDKFSENGIEIDTFLGVGTIAERNPFIMQLYADILKTPVKVSGTSQSPVIGSAILAAYAATSANGGYDDIDTASDVMGNLKPDTYYPILENSEIYDKMYEEYCKLGNLFTSDKDNIMQKLINIQASVIK